MDKVKRPLVSKVKISDDVIITAARLAALDVKGVAGLAGEIRRINKIKNNGPIVVSAIGDVAALDVNIRVCGGEKAVAVAQEVQSAVKENVQNMTGVTVARVNVTVCGVVYE